MESITLSHDRAPGDVIAMTALVRDIALAHPGKYAISVRTPYQDVWRNNPYIVPRSTVPERIIKLSYGESIRRASKECIHFLTAWHYDFAKQTKIQVPLFHPKPDLHLTDEEKNNRIVDGRYWLILSGGKMDFTTKHYVYSRHQKVVDCLRKCGIPVVQGGARDKGPPANFHPELDGALNLIGRTNLREFMRLIYQSEGVICTITAAMHIAAAFDRPCVVIAGGREEWWWEGYSNTANNFGPVASGKVEVAHKYLHTLGKLDCCSIKGCWKNKVTHNENDKRNSYCSRPTTSDNGQRVPECMDMIQTTHIVEAVMQYYKDGVLPPIGPAPTIILPDGEKIEPSPKRVQLPMSLPLPAAPALRPLLPVPVIINEPQGNKATIISAPPPPQTVYDHARVGGKFTVFVLMYGDFFDMHKRCIDAILKTCPPERIDLRVGSNQLCPASLEYVNRLGSEGRIQLHYCYPDNRKKYPVMRTMFHDPDRPIDTKWLIWFDDDTMCNKNPDWLVLLSQQIINYPDIAMFGPHQFYTVGPGQAQWIKEAPWYTRKPLRDRSGHPVPNGNRVHFCTGSFWALKTETIVKCDIPDNRLGHNGGDWTIGEQLYQGGFKLKGWTGSKNIVNWSSAPRRGLQEAHPGKTPLKPVS